MGLIAQLFGLLFGGNRNIVKETAEIFRENAEAAGTREATAQAAALDQFGREFATPKAGGFDRFMDGVNRVPRPAMALGTLALFGAAMTDPVWFASRMQGLALVPEPLWWLMGAIVGFYFGARVQVKGQEFRRSIADTMQRATEVTANLRALDALDAPADAGLLPDPANAALDDWRHNRE